MLRFLATAALFAVCSAYTESHSHPGLLRAKQDSTALALAGGGEGVDHAFQPDKTLKDGDRISGTGWSVEVMHTPGHFAGHLAFAGGDPLRMIDKHHARISHVHTKDIRQPVVDALDFESESFLDAVIKGAFTVPGDGSLDFDAIVARLGSYGYEGWFVIEAEQDPLKADPVGFGSQHAPENASVVRDITGYGWHDGKWMSDRAARNAAQTCIGRNGEMADMDGPLLFLCSDASRYVTGQVHVIDGAMTL